MNPERLPAVINRRTLLVLACGSLAVASCNNVGTQNPMAKAAPFVKPGEIWSADHLFLFLSALPPPALLQIKKSQAMLKRDAVEADLQGPVEDARSIQKQLLWLSSNVLAYPFKDATAFSYHEEVKWIAEKAGVDDGTLRSGTTFRLESELHRLLFAEMWEKLSPEQRADLLQKLDPNGTIKDRAAITSMSGAGALVALSGTVAFTGFAFYTTMSVTVASVAGAVGATLPFATYTGASATVGLLSGPIGWAIAGVSALGGLALAGRANVRKTAALVAEIHALKIEALRAAGASAHELFGV
jgi:uncharacterized protein YaaW (UPF0174 family)